jgi:hypothetical protein
MDALVPRNELVGNLVVRVERMVFVLLVLVL